MPRFPLSFFAGPRAVRDLAVGSLAIPACIAAFLLGCAFVSVSNVVWFAFLGILGVTASVSGLRAFADARRLAVQIGTGDRHKYTRVAA